MKINVVENSLSSCLRILGRKIAKYPIYFMIIPCISSIIMGTGIIKIKYNRDLKYLGVSQTGRAASNKNIIEQLYPENYSVFTDFARNIDILPGIVVQIFDKTGQNMLNRDVLRELKQLEEIVQGVRIQSKGRKIGYSDLCAVRNKRCFENPLIKLIPRFHEIIRKKLRIKYPIEIDLFSLSYQPYVMNLGGVTTDLDNNVEEVKALRLMYPTVNHNATLVKKWENSVIKELLRKDFNNITVIPFVFSDLMVNVKKFTEASPFIASVIAAIVALFSLISCMTDNWIRSKPWLGTSACISAGLSLITAFGIMSYLGVENNDANICICFLVLGTEIDDAYILIASWRATSPTDSVEKRMGDTFKEAAVSITITSVTNVISLCIGLTVPFPVIKQFCGYAATSMFFAYIYQITFFGSCMVLDGHREKRNLHPFTFKKIPRATILPEEEKLMGIFKDKIGTFLTRTPIKVIIIIVFLVNLCIGIWGLFYLQDGVDVRIFVPKNSLTFQFIDNHYKYFGQYFGTMQIVINQTLNYENSTVQKSIERMIRSFTSHPNIANSDLMLNWLEYYKMFANKQIVKNTLMRGYNLNEKKEFIDGLQNVFLRTGGTKEFAKDIIFNENKTEITCSRFIVLLKDIYSMETNSRLLKDVWKISDDSEFSLILHNAWFLQLEEGIIMRGITTQIMWITALIIIVVFFLFIPQPVTALLVSLIITSTIIETAGYMAFWGLALNMGTVTVIILCVGFSVNYPSHASYAYVMCKQKTPNEKLKNCLYHVGLPIFQGCVSTILAVSVLGINEVKAYVIFFIVVFLITLFTTFHAMFVIPVLLTISGSITYYRKSHDGNKNTSNSR